MNFAVHGTALLDFKSTAGSVHPDTLRRKIENDRLYFQAAWYWHGYSEATGEKPEGFYHVVYSTDPPYPCAVYRLDEEYIRAGLVEMHDALAILRACIRDNDWPGYARQIVTLRPSRWFLNERA